MQGLEAERSIPPPAPLTKGVGAVAHAAKPNASDKVGTGKTLGLGSLRDKIPSVVSRMVTREMLVFRRLALILDSSANIALAVASLLLLNSFAVVTLIDSNLPPQNERAVSHTAQVAGDLSSVLSAKAEVTALATGEARASSVADFMRAPVIRPAEVPNLFSLDPNFLKKVRSPISVDTSSKAPRTQLANTLAPISLPWEAVEPVRFRDNEKINSVDAPADAESGGEDVRASEENLTALDLPSTERLLKWVKANAKTFKGSERRRSLIHFELWLDPPKDIRDSISSVDYDLRSDAVQPRKQESRNANSGFRAGFGSLACAREIVMTVHFDDGRSQAIEVDGCALMALNAPKRQGS